jgi:hypothetical protein
MIRYRVDVRILALDHADVPAFVIMMKHLNLPHTLGTSGEMYATVCVHIDDVSKIQKAWEDRGFTFQEDRRK